MGDSKRKEMLPTLIPGSTINEGLFLAEGIYVVSGAKRAAVYKTPTKEVFSINEPGKSIIFGEIRDAEYLTQLEKMGILIKNPLSERVNPASNTCSRNKVDFVWFELTPDCNERCTHCYADCSPVISKTEEAKRLTFDNWKTAIIQAKELGCDSGQFIGGEPFLYRGKSRQTVLDLAEFARQSGFKTLEIFSNATLLTESKIRRIKDLGLNMAVSLYSSVPKIHDQITKTPGSWVKTVENLKLLKRHGVATRVEVIITKANEGTIDETLQFIVQLGFEKSKPDVVRPNGRGENAGVHPSVETQIKYGYVLEPNFPVDENRFLNAQHFNPCLAGKVTITNDGSVLPCIFSRNQIVGNILNNPLTEIVSGRRLQMVWQTSNDRILVCQDCEYRYACSDCRPLSFGANGNKNYFHAPSPRCTYNPYEGQWGEGFWKLDSLDQRVYDLSKSEEIKNQRRLSQLSGGR